MHSSLRTKVALWFLFVAIVVGLAGYIGFRRLSDYILHQARAQMDAKLDHVIDVLGTTNSTYLNLVHSSMAVLRMLGREKGQPHLEWTVNSNGPPEAVLYFGATPVAGDDTLVDKLKELMGGTAGIFAKQDESFVRISTNLLRSDGSRAVDSLLDPDSAAFAAIRRVTVISASPKFSANPTSQATSQSEPPSAKPSVFFMLASRSHLSPRSTRP
jgi:methyl-accepting chemotaxis protein